MAKMIEERDRLLFNKVMHNPEHCLHELLPEERQRPLKGMGNKNNDLLKIILIDKLLIYKHYTKISWSLKAF
jgi:hypothetical protein